jgi:hypothetical protein
LRWRCLRRKPGQLAERKRECQNGDNGQSADDGEKHQYDLAKDPERAHGRYDNGLTGQ